MNKRAETIHLLVAYIVIFAVMLYLAYLMVLRVIPAKQAAAFVSQTVAGTVLAHGSYVTDGWKSVSTGSLTLTIPHTFTIDADTMYAPDEFGGDRAIARWTIRTGTTQEGALFEYLAPDDADSFTVHPLSDRITEFVYTYKLGEIDDNKKPAGTYYVVSDEDFHIIITGTESFDLSMWGSDELSTFLSSVYIR
jgi:hypothetical protein